MDDKAKTAQQETGERMLAFFATAHLPEKLAAVSRPFADLAIGLCVRLKSGPERTVMLRKLLEAKDCAVRCALED